MRPPLLALLLLLACGGGDDPLDRFAEEHRDDRGDAPAAAAALPPGAYGIAAEEVEYARVQDRPVRGYFARPDDAGSGSAPPALIVIHEWWGLNDSIRAMARRLAQSGYAALAVDLYGGESTADPSEARALAGAAQARAAELEENLRQAHAWLERERSAPRVGVIGWCFGGGWSLRTAQLLPEEIDATVVYYGRVPGDAAALAPLRGPVLGLFAELDQAIPLSQVRAFERALGAAGVRHEVHVYAGVHHAFANPSGTRYAPEAALDAWRRTLGFLGANLVGE